MSIYLCLGAACASSEALSTPADPEPGAATPAAPWHEAGTGHRAPEHATLPAQLPPTPVTSPEQTGRYDVVASEPGGAARWTPPTATGTAELARRQRQYLDASKALDREAPAVAAAQRERHHADLKHQILGE
jgi:hypothetical protein